MEADGARELRVHTARGGIQQQLHGSPAGWHPFRAATPERLFTAPTLPVRGTSAHGCTGVLPGRSLTLAGQQQLQHLPADHEQHNARPRQLQEAEEEHGPASVAPASRGAQSGVGTRRRGGQQVKGAANELQKDEVWCTRRVGGSRRGTCGHLLQSCRKHAVCVRSVQVKAAGSRQQHGQGNSPPRTCPLAANKGTSTSKTPSAAHPPFMQAARWSSGRRGRSLCGMC